MSSFLCYPRLEHTFQGEGCPEARLERPSEEGLRPVGLGSWEEVMGWSVIRGSFCFLGQNDNRCSLLPALARRVNLQALEEAGDTEATSKTAIPEAPLSGTPGAVAAESGTLGET